MGLLDRGTDMKGKQISEEEQQTLDIFITNGVKLIHNEKVSDELIAKIRGSRDKIEGIAFALIDIINRVEKSAIANKIKLTSIVIVHGGNHLLAEIINIAEKAGLVEPLNEDQRKQAFSIATSKYIDDAVKSGKITREQLNQMSQQFQATPQGKQVAEQFKQQKGNIQKTQPSTVDTQAAPPVNENGG